MSISQKGPPPVDLKAGFSRKMRCPRCAVEFETPKRFELDCSKCGHRWQEEVVRSRSEKLSLWLADVADRTVMPFLLLIAGLAVFALVAPLFYLLWRYAGLDDVEGVVIGAGFLVAILGLSAMQFNRRERYESLGDSARRYHKRRGPRRRGN